ncbi:MAG: DNA mismatch repair endonuclease MutL [Pyrinomonadaceae bacterium]
MSKIRVLPDHLANQIAAGEVVERPSSVAKELVENSIDAGATRIEIDVEGGGRRQLRVSDDGEGMTRDDALLAFERHATSKIREIEDLNRIATLGFRGEALASIASVARIELITQREAEEAGTRVVIEGGRMRDVQPAAHPRGTRITARDLFFNVPARRKFLRSEATETFHLTNLVTHYALAHPEIAFTLTSNGRETLRAAPANDLRERAYQIFGAEFIEHLLEVNGGHEFVARVRGYVSAPRERRTSRDAQYLFVNGRFVRDRLVSRALSEGFRSILPHGVFPAALLFLEVPLEEVDVNVHPAKTEVRFRRAAAVMDAVRESVRAALASNGFAPRVNESSREETHDIDESDSRDTETRHHSYDAIKNISPQQETIDFRAPVAEEDVLLRRDDLPQGDEASPSDTTNVFDIESVTAADTFAQQALERRADATSLNADEQNSVNTKVQPTTHEQTNEALSISNDTNANASHADFSSSTFQPSPPADAPQTISPNSSQTQNPATSQKSPHPTKMTMPPLDNAINLMREVAVESLTSNIRPLGQLDESFIIATDKEGLLLIDQHVAHERILFDKYRRLLEERRAESQQLLVPETFDLTPAQAVTFDKIAPELESHGFGLMRLSGRTVAIKAVPADLPASEARNLLAEILDTIDMERRGAARENLRDGIAASLACRAAIKINTPLTTEKMQWLIDRVLQTSSPTTCPHGRPVILRLATRDLLKGFHRT